MKSSDLKERLLRKMAEVTHAHAHERKQLAGIGAKAAEWETQLGTHVAAAAKVLASSVERNPALEMMHRQALAGRARCQQLHAVVTRRGRTKS